MLIGDLKSLGLLWTNLAKNRRYQPYVSEFDIQTFNRRLLNEGLTFIAETLPTIGKALDSFHSTLEWTCPPGWESTRGRRSGSDAPEYFCLDSSDVLPPEGLSDYVIDGNISRFYVVPLFLHTAIEAALNGDSIAVDCVRQLTLIFYKLEVGHGKEKVEQFLERFKQVDRGLVSVFDSSNVIQADIIVQMRRDLERILCNYNPLHIKPSHGSGATACRTPNWKKHHRTLQYFEKLDDVYPYSEYFFYNFTHLSDEMSRLESALPIAVPRARVCLVPKDSRGPRVISCEPAELMFIQQGIMRLLYRILETHELTSGQINFSDQTINRELAFQSSKGDLDLATIDLSDASDRVSLELVEKVFPDRWVEALKACRSEETELPNGEIIKLNKFAPMGSSCCFPVEALVFWACARASIRILGNVKHIPHVYVYGDDIICPSIYYTQVMSGLHLIGLQVNETKSYWRGPFRESCGGDYHNGYDVTPVRVRKSLSKSRTSVTTNADLANMFIAKFGYTDASLITSVIESEGGYVYPRSELQLPAVVRCSPGASNDVFFVRRFNKNLQRWEHRILTCISESKQRQPPNWEELFRKELSRDRSSGNTVSTFSNHEKLDRTSPVYEHWVAKLDDVADPGWYTDPHSVVTKWVWTWLGSSQEV
ncbi:RNA-directed RNA polymerase [ssRNA phage Gerhypos.1_21]|uniref:RNA-directed RNA polymerase n=2 Tax=Leviviricetes TaxID=2842243 RepID=A0A8S5L2C6_9VIRU|nr:RNA-directed RNA polymerase [ssRNA phage Gerhypos.1_21]QDH90652.1 MAG: RNA-dependent RNA polymerase [Leviviridae sp.]DAD51793.1 TPA_asm: RNA-directed RNA polymerase [ssRNA phage Gerhypos.1_21]